MYGVVKQSGALDILVINAGVYEGGDPLEFDPDTSWDEKKEIYRMSDKIVRTANVTQSAVGDKNGRWTTTIAAAILIFDDK